MAQKKLDRNEALCFVVVGEISPEFAIKEVRGPYVTPFNERSVKRMYRIFLWDVSYTLEITILSSTVQHACRVVEVIILEEVWLNPDTCRWVNNPPQRIRTQWPIDPNWFSPRDEDPI